MVLRRGGSEEVQGLGQREERDGGGSSAGGRRRRRSSSRRRRRRRSGERGRSGAPLLVVRGQPLRAPAWHRSSRWGPSCEARTQERTTQSSSSSRSRDS